MLRPRFHTTQPLRSGQTITLEKEPSRHIARALRMRAGEQLCLFDGKGCEVAATISSVDRDRVTVTTDEPAPIDRESPLPITLAIALSRGDRMDTVIQKATELGVSAIWPLVSERTGVRLDASRLARKREHWERIAISACEQCGRNRIPEISDTDSYTEILAKAQSADALRLILHLSAAAEALPTACPSLLLLVGPEGGFSDAEVAAAMDAGFHAAQLGPRVLRTETAPIAALAVAQARWGDFAV